MQMAAEPPTAEPSAHDLRALSERQEALEAMVVLLASASPDVDRIITLLKTVRDMADDEDPPRKTHVEVFDDAIRLLRRVRTSRSARHG